MPNIIEEKPKLFEKTDTSIWTDPYIQQNLLNEQLNLSSDAAGRNERSMKIISDFIDSRIGKRAEILDLGCGPGFYVEILSEKGHSVTGIDFNKKAIEYAKMNNKYGTYIEDDYIVHFPKGVYDTIMMIYCDMGTHSDNDRNTLLKNCFDSLKEGGKLIFDVFDEDLIKDKKEGKNWEYSSGEGFWSNDSYIILSQMFHYPENKTFACRYNLVTDKEVKHFIIWDRYYSENEITQILKKIGFKKIEIKHNLPEGNDFTSDNQLFVIAEK